MATSGEADRARPARVAAGVKEVAAAAGVSLGTVSNVLNRPEMVSPVTRAKVEAAMASLGFVRNESARQLRAGSSRILAYVMLDAGNPFFTDVARGVEDAAREAGLAVFLCNSNEDARREADYLDLLEQQRVQGVLITPVDPDSDLLSKLPARGTPVVVVDRSNHPSARYALQMATGTASPSASAWAYTMRNADTGMRSPRIELTLSRVLYERPKSPWSASPSQRT